MPRETLLQCCTLTRILINFLFYLVGTAPKYVVLNYAFFTCVDIIGYSGFITGVKRCGKDMMLHHFVVMFIGFPYLFYYRVADVYGNLLLTFEISTLFYVLYGLTRLTLYKYLFGMAFFLTRIVYGWGITSDIYRANPLFSMLTLFL